MKELEKQEIEYFLKNAPDGILALTDGTQPYCVPIAFVYADDSIFVAMFPKGRKWEYFQKNNHACLNVLTWDSTRTQWASIIVDGVMKVVTELETIEVMVKANITKMGLDEKVYLKQRMDYYSANLDNPTSLKIVQLNIEKASGRAT